MTAVIPVGRDALARAADVAYRARRSRERKAALLLTRETDKRRARAVFADAKAMLLEMPPEPLHVVVRRRLILTCQETSLVEGELPVRDLAEGILERIGPDPCWEEHRRVLLAALAGPGGGSGRVVKRRRRGTGTRPGAQHPLPDDPRRE